MNEQEQKTILLVEDEALIAVIGKQTLKKHGFNVIIAASGEKAIEIAQTTPDIDLILMDINLGKGRMDGTEAAEIILKERAIPVLFLSSYTQPEVVEKTERITSYGYVTKDSGHTVLIASIKMAFKLYEAHQRLKEREGVLRESEEKYRSIFENAVMGIFRTTPDGHYLSINPAGAKMYGYKSPEEMIQSVTDMAHQIYVHSEDRNRLKELVENNGFVEGFEAEHYSKDGSTIWASVNTRVIRDNSGTILYYETTSEDITSRKQAEQALQESELHYRSLIECSSDAIFCVDENGEYKFTNHLFASTFGETPDYFIGKTFWDIYPKEHADYRYEATKRVFLTGKSESLEVEVPLPDKTLYFYATANPIKDETGKVILVLTHATDITERKRMEESLKEREKRFALAIDGTGAGLWDWDMVKAQVVYSPQWKRMLGYEIHEVEDTFSGWKNLWHPDDCANIEKALQDYLAGETDHYEIRHRLRHKDGDWRWILTRGDIVKDAQGKPIRWVGTNIDITEHKQAEEELRQQATAMEASMDGIAILNEDQNYVYLNEAHARIYGYSTSEELIGKSWQVLYDEDELQRFNQHIMPEFSQKGQWQGEVRGKKKDGNTFPQEVSLTALDNGGLICVARDITSRKQAEKALLQAEKKYRSIFENAVEGIFQTTPEGRYISANPAIAKIFGYDSPQELMEQITDIGSQHYVNLQDREIYKSTLEVGGVIRGFEVQLINKDGNTIWAFISARVVKDDGGSVICYEGTVEDITARKQAEKALKQSDARLSNIIEFLPDATFVIDLEGKIISWNRAIEEMTGFPAETMLGKGDYEYAIPFYGNRRPILINFLSSWDEDIEKQYSFIRKEGDMLFTETDIPSVRGQKRTLWAAASPLHDDYGNIIGAIESIRDVTDRKQAQESLKESEDRYRRITEGLSDYLYTVLIHDGHVVQTIHSPACEAVTGYTAEEFASNPYLWIDMVPEQEHAMLNEHIKRVQSGENLFPIEHHIIRKDGNIIRVIDTPITKVDSQGVLISYDGVIKDITELKQAEEEKRILQERLQQADKMEAIGTLAGGIAHDFNNLLMGIQGYASLTLMDTDPSHPNYERLKRIEEQVQSGADLTRQLLGFAREGRYEVKPADMNDILKKTSSMFGRTKKEITIHRKYGKDLFTVEVDRGQMEQVFVNLYVNAWQAMPGGGELYLETENVLLDNEQTFPYAVKPGNYIRISMTDTGAGMDEKTRKRIFDPFFTTKEMGRGTGLGLAMVYGIIKGHNGFINVDSYPGHGTTFTIYLPASEKEVVKEKTTTGTIARGTETILLVDDEKMVLKVSKELLESMGYQVYTAGSGQEAIVVYMEKRNEIDLVILDMIMPGISGGETFDRLKEINPDIKVVLFSGYSINGQAQEIMDKGCNGFLQKPFRIEMLSNKIREMLDME